MGRFWSMLAHYHGQVWNSSELAASLGVSHHTARSYLEALEQTFLVRRLLPWHANLGKRLVKSPKIYFRDTGLLHALLGIHDSVQLVTHPKLGASWEGFAIEQLLRAEAPEEAWFYAVHSGAELDLVMVRGGRRIGVEVKRADAPATTRSMRTARQDLGLDELWIVYPGARRFTLEDGVLVRPLVDSAETER
jgi:predicted AAA+ superfamily ATPase